MEVRAGKVGWGEHVKGFKRERYVLSLEEDDDDDDDLCTC